MNYETEEWKQIQEAPRYYISNLGRVKSFAIDKKNGHLLAIHCDRYGYQYVKLTPEKGQNRRFFRIHRLIAEYWKDNYFSGAVIHHKDGDRTNNSIDNLEILTPQEHNRLPKKKKNSN